MTRSVENTPAAVLAAAREMLANAGNISVRKEDSDLCMTPLRQNA